MSDDAVERIPIEECTPPGTIKVTLPALELAKRFQASVPSGCTVVFNWFDGQRIKASKDAPWVDQGPGLGLGAYWAREIPEEAICHSGDFCYAVLIRKDIVDAHPDKTIDLDGPRSVVLR